MTLKTLALQSWGRVSEAVMEASRPEQIADAVSAMRNAHKGGMVFYGAGRSYGDAPLNHNGQALLTERLNRLLSFDPETGELAAEAGITFAELLRTFLPQGFLPQAMPGTAFTTLGGAIANDIHGKNHDCVGSIGQHINWIELLLPSGQVVRVSPTQQPELFQATIGGIGLTGLILAAGLQLMRVPSNAVLLRKSRVANLDDYLRAFDESPKENMVYSVGWIDGLARGKHLGRGILEISTPIPTDLPVKSRHAWTVPMNVPHLAMHPLNIKIFNELYFRRIPARGREEICSYENAAFPLDALTQLNRIYGKRGFYQFQCVLPRDEGAQGLQRLMETITKSSAASCLAVLKTLGGEGLGYLSFPMKGYTLALDFPRRPGTEALLKQLETITLEHGGRVYLAKDACLSADNFAQMYPKLDAFRRVLDEVDPDMRLVSDMARRLKIRDYRR